MMNSNSNELDANQLGGEDGDEDDAEFGAEGDSNEDGQNDEADLLDIQRSLVSSNTCLYPMQVDSRAFK